MVVKNNIKRLKVKIQKKMKKNQKNQVNLIMQLQMQIDNNCFKMEYSKDLDFLRL